MHRRTFALMALVAALDASVSGGGVPDRGAAIRARVGGEIIVGGRKAPAPLALEGYCPVTVTQNMVWKKGRAEFRVAYDGRTYCFDSEEKQSLFFLNPERYALLWSGVDPVIALEQGKREYGIRTFGLIYQNRMILFAGKESYDKFCKSSRTYLPAAAQGFLIGGR